MGKYRFKLNALLKLQKNKEQVVQKELGEVYKTREGIISKQNQLLHKQGELFEEISSYEGNTLDVLEIQRLYKYSTHLKQEQNKVMTELKHNDQEVNRVKHKLTEAVKEKKIYENLKERSYEKWLKEEQEAEQKVVDELISYKYSSR